MATKQAQPTRWTLYVASEYGVVDSNPENAEMGNPNGDRVDLVYFLGAQDQLGYRRRTGWFRTKAEAAAYLPLSSPVEFWDDTYPEYGSEAYQEMEPELVWQERQDDMDFERYGYTLR